MGPIEASIRKETLKRRRRLWQPPASAAPASHASSKPDPAASVFDLVCAAIEAETGVGKELITAVAHVQNARVAQARHIAIYLLKSLFRWKGDRIAAAIGCHHTTCVHAVFRVEALIASDPQFAVQFATIKRRIEQTITAAKRNIGGHNGAQGEEPKQGEELSGR